MFRLLRIDHEIVATEGRPHIVLEFIAQDKTKQRVKFTYAQLVHFIAQLEQ